MRSKLFLLVFCAVAACLPVSTSAQSYAITNAKVVTVSGATIDKGNVIIRGGLIEAVGADVKVPADAIVIEASGLTVYPGFIDTNTSLGLPAAPARTPGGPGQGGPGQQQQAAPTSNSNYAAGLRPEDSADGDIKAGDAQFEANRNAGFTTALSVGRSGIFNGQSVIINLAGDTVPAMVVRSPFAQHISYTTLGFQSYPTSLLGTFAVIRQMFYDAKRQQEIEKAYAANPRGMKRPDADKSLTALYPAVNRQMPVVFNANTEREIIRSLDLIKELGLVGIIAGGQEAGKVADRLKAANVSVLLSLNLPKRTTANSPDADPEPMEILRLRAEAPKNAAKLAAAGVKFAFQSDQIRSIPDLFANAQKTIEAGLSRDAAIRAMTLSAAELLGIADRTGSLEAGKIANVTVVKGDLFGKDRFVSHVFVDGKLFEIKEPPKAPERPAGGPGGRPSAAADISGSYAITIEVPGSPLPATLNFTQTGGSLTGTMSSSLGNSTINGGKASADGFSFTTAVSFQGQNIDITVTGKVTGSSITGTVSSPMGDVPFSGTKNP